LPEQLQRYDFLLSGESWRSARQHGCRTRRSVAGKPFLKRIIVFHLPRRVSANTILLAKTIMSGTRHFTMSNHQSSSQASRGVNAMKI